MLSIWDLEAKKNGENFDLNFLQEHNNLICGKYFGP